jgi:hypothetical protein
VRTSAEHIVRITSVTQSAAKGLMARCFILLLAFFIGPADSIAQTLKASAPAQVQLGQQFQISFSIDDSGDNFTPPDFSRFRVLGGPNRSSSMQFVNGSMTQSLTLSFYLQAIEVGEINIGQAQMTVDGKVVKSNPLKIKVLKGKAGAKSGPKKQNNQGAQQPAQANAETLFGELELSKRNVDRGEQIIAIHKVYSRVSVVNLEGIELPTFEGFWKEDIDPGAQIQVKDEIRDGVQYQVLELKKTILYPQKAGNIEIPATPVDLVIRQQSGKRSRSIFDMFGGGYQNVRASLVIPGATINVKDLPSSGKPADFTGLTGTFNMKTKVNRTELKSNETIDLKITISGKGNLYQVRAPELDLPPDVESYDPKTSDKIKVSPSGISGSRTFEYLLIPRYAGEFELGPFTFSYYDPKQNKYVTKQSEMIVINVEKGDEEEGGTQGTINVASKEDLKVIGSDIRYIKQGQYLIITQGDLFYRSGSFYLILLMPFILLTGFFGYRGYIASTVGNEAHTKSKRAKSLSRKRLKTAEKLKNENKEAEFYEEIQKAMSGFIGDQFNVPQSEMSKEKITSLFNEKEVPTEVSEAYLKVMSDAEFKRYAPSSGGSMSEIYNQAMNAVIKIQDHV